MSLADATHCGVLTREEIARRRAEGVPTTAIAAAAGVCKSTLYLALQAWGLSTARGGDRRSGEWRQRFIPQLGGAA